MIKYIKLDDEVAHEMIEGDLGLIYDEIPGMMGGWEHYYHLSDGRVISWSPLDGQCTISICSHCEPWGREPMVACGNVKYVLLVVQNDVEDETGTTTTPLARVSASHYYDLMVHPRTVL